MEWISVKDRVPRLHAKVLILNKYEEQFVALCVDDLTVELCIECNCEGGGTEALNVTHWMPLPEPPKEEK